MSKTPKLRFKEFSGDWEEKKLGTLGQFLKGSILSKADLSEEGKPCVLYGELYTKYSEVIKNVISKTNLENDKLVLGKKNDVLIPSSGETAIDIATASCLQQDNVILGGDLNVFRSDKVNGVFTSYQLNSSKKREIARLSQGASVVHIYNEQLKKIKLSVPSKEEQEKIASFFSLIDEKISLQSEKVEALKDYKRGMMQKIFSQELRFKADNDEAYQNWNKKKLIKLTEKITTKNKDFVITNVISNSAKNGLISQRDFFDKDIANQSNIYGYYVIEPGDFVYNPRKSIESPYGPINRYELQDAGIVSPLYLCFRVNNEEINGKFLAYYFKSSVWHRFIYQNSDQGVRHDRVSIKDAEFFNMDIGVPEIDEQNKIVKFLDGLECKLSKEQDKLDYLNEYKKGLLQEMFI
ncbi:restriction endonuclease subunit S [Romboutsia ilealis]|uniref:restriction endonuclease subunit S n=1 Tax=Romboutsia ilealis TaxID=1115758 RepID=UPI00259C993C|nr:restriction endonuclease subunit S [Romboutsia ilealis]